MIQSSGRLFHYRTVDRIVGFLRNHLKLTHNEYDKH